jgi:formate hydrogenlyase subunit 6/NADH:ubiquinone oxidoreductase subunit I
MFSSIAVRIAQGRQYIPDVRAARPDGFRARPVVSDVACASGCSACTQRCPTQALALDSATASITVDLGRCVMCGDCAAVCPENKIGFSNDPRLSTTTREALVVSQARPELDPIITQAALRSLFGRV